MPINDLWRTFLATKRHLLKICVINSFLVNQEIVKFFGWAVEHLMLGLGGQN